MTFEEAVSYLETFVNYEMKSHYHPKTAFNLERVKSFLSHIGTPQKGLKVMHVAGTKGKGSTACFLAHILKEQGFRVGLYTSPHLKDFRERIRILDPDNTADEKVPFSGMILKNDFAELLSELKLQIDSFQKKFHNLGSLSFFDILTAVALKYFKEKGVDFVVLEAGLGGRFDATNAVDSHVCVITPVSYDHEHVLGNTLIEIAFEKAGVIKNSNIRTDDGLCVCISASQSKEVHEVLKRRSKAQEAVLFEAGKDFYSKKLGGDLFSQDFFYSGLSHGSAFFKTRMLGSHQLENASLALACCEALSLHGIKIRSDSMNAGIFNAFWPGRLEIIHTKPFIVLDGAHNRVSAERLAYFIEREFKKFRKWLIFGVSLDKDIGAIVEQLEPLVDRIILTRSDNPRAADPHKKLRSYFKKQGVVATSSVEEALALLKKEIKPDDVAVVAGSLFVIGEARSIWQR